MTPSELTTLANHIRANTDPAVVAALQSGAHNEIARLYNLSAVPEYLVWRTTMTADQLRAAAINGSSEMDNLEAGKRDSLYWLLSGSLNPSQSAVRQAFTDLTANRTGGFVATTLRSALSTAAKRPATVFEKVFASTVLDQGAYQLDLVGPVSVADVSLALNSNP